MHSSNEQHSTTSVRVVKFNKESTPNALTSKTYVSQTDFIKLIKTDPELEEEFCYLNKKSHAYDWEIVAYKNRDPVEYITISKRVFTKSIGSHSFSKWANHLYDASRVGKGTHALSTFD